MCLYVDDYVSMEKGTKESTLESMKVAVVIMVTDYKQNKEKNPSRIGNAPII